MNEQRLIRSMKCLTNWLTNTNVKSYPMNSPNNNTSNNMAVGVFRPIIHSPIAANTMHTNEKIEHVIERLEDLLISKNNTYGDSLQNPVRIFSKLDRMESISGRIDDKLSRIAAVGVTDQTKDTLFDLMGYIVHLIIVFEDENI